MAQSPAVQEHLERERQPVTIDVGGAGGGVVVDERLTELVALALARAIDAFAEAGMLDHVRPAAKELAERLEALQGESAEVKSMGAARGKQRT